MSRVVSSLKYSPENGKLDITPSSIGCNGLVVPIAGGGGSVSFSSITGSPLDNTALKPYIEIESTGNSKPLSQVNPIQDYIFYDVKFDVENPISSFTHPSKNKTITYIFGSANHPMSGAGSTWFNLEINLNTDGTYSIEVKYKAPDSNTDTSFIVFDSTVGTWNPFYMGPFANDGSSYIHYDGSDDWYFFGEEGSSNWTDYNVICDAEYRIEPNVINHLEDAFTKIAINSQELANVPDFVADYVSSHHQNYYSHNIVFTEIGGEVSVRIQNTVSSIPTYTNIINFLSSNSFLDAENVFTASGYLTPDVGEQMVVVGIFTDGTNVFATNGTSSIALANEMVDKVILIGGGWRN